MAYYAHLNDVHSRRIANSSLDPAAKPTFASHPPAHAGSAQAQESSAAPMMRPGGAGEAVAPRDWPAAGQEQRASRRLLQEELRRKPPSDKDVSALRHTRAVPVTALAALRDNVKLLTSQVCLRFGCIVESLSVSLPL